MLARERKTHLLAVLDRDGRVVAKAVAAALGVSDDSIRRDLRELAEIGACVRVYGGALPAGSIEPPVSARQDVSPASKERVARAALERIEDGDTVIIDGGTTALALAQLLPPLRSLTVVTPSPPVAVVIGQRTDARVIMIGGELARRSMVNGGAMAIEAARQVHADSFFMGVAGVDVERGLTTGTIEDAATKRALAAQSARVFVLASEDKIGVVSRVSVLPLDQVTEIIFDPEDSHPAVAAFRRHR
jgi:DeoR/GlpR family transcriptional regulator of sugar metabolism